MDTLSHLRRLSPWLFTPILFINSEELEFNIKGACSIMVKDDFTFFHTESLRKAVGGIS